jgi:hypothetical protein
MRKLEALKLGGVQREEKKETSWSLLGPGVKVGLSLSFIDYVRLSLK